MRKTAVRIVSCTTVSYMLLIIGGLSSCGNAEAGPDNATPVVIESQSAPDEDTIRFTAFEPMRIYFKKKQDSATARFKSAASDPKRSHLLDSMKVIIEMQRLASSYQLLQSKGITAETNGAITALIMNRWFAFDRVDSIYSRYPEELKKTTEWKFQGVQLEKRRAQEKISSYAISILQAPIQDINGQTTKLDDIDENYLLLDFWTSWCIPCRKLNREMAGIQQKIEAGGKVKVVLLSLDAHGNNWKKAVSVDKSPFLNLWEPLALSSPIAVGLNVTKYPHNVLMDKKGRIYGTNLHGEVLLKAISKLP